MADVFGIDPSISAGRISPADQSRPKTPTVEASAAGDTVKISEAGNLAAKIHEIPIVRVELIEQVKAQIAAGTYETPERIEAAVKGLAEEFYIEY